MNDALKDAVDKLNRALVEVLREARSPSDWNSIDGNTRFWLKQVAYHLRVCCGRAGHKRSSYTRVQLPRGRFPLRLSAKQKSTLPQPGISDAITNTFTGVDYHDSTSTLTAYNKAHPRVVHMQGVNIASTYRLPQIDACDKANRMNNSSQNVTGEVLNTNAVADEREYEKAELYSCSSLSGETLCESPQPQIIKHDLSRNEGMLHVADDAISTRAQPGQRETKATVPMIEQTVASRGERKKPYSPRMMTCETPITVHSGEKCGPLPPVQPIPAIARPSHVSVLEQARIEFHLSYQHIQDAYCSARNILSSNIKGHIDDFVNFGYRSQIIDAGPEADTWQGWNSWVSALEHNGGKQSLQVRIGLLKMHKHHEDARRLVKTGKKGRGVDSEVQALLLPNANKSQQNNYHRRRRCGKRLSLLLQVCGNSLGIMLGAGKCLERLTSKHTTNDRYRAFCFFLWRLFPPIVKMAKTFDQLANRTFDLSCYSRDESQGLEVPTRNSAAYKGFKECFWPSLQAEAELHAENIQCGLDKVTQDEHQEWSDYQTRVERGILPSPEKLVCGASGPPLSVCTINKLFHLLESSMTSSEGSLSLKKRSTYRHDQLKAQTRVRVRPAIVLGMDPCLRHAHVLTKELQEFSDTGANTTRVGGAVRLIQPWWHEGRWQAAIFDKESASLCVTLIDPWNQAGAEAIKMIIGHEHVGMAVVLRSIHRVVYPLDGKAFGHREAFIACWWTCRELAMLRSASDIARDREIGSWEYQRHNLALLASTDLSEEQRRTWNQECSEV